MKPLWMYSTHDIEILSKRDNYDRLNDPYIIFNHLDSINYESLSVYKIHDDIVISLAKLVPDKISWVKLYTIHPEYAKYDWFQKSYERYVCHEQLVYHRSAMHGLVIYTPDISRLPVNSPEYIKYHHPLSVNYLIREFVRVLKSSYESYSQMADQVLFRLTGVYPEVKGNIFSVDQQMYFMMQKVKRSGMIICVYLDKIRNPTMQLNMRRSDMLAFAKGYQLPISNCQWVPNIPKQLLIEPTNIIDQHTLFNMRATVIQRHWRYHIAWEKTFGHKIRMRLCSPPCEAYPEGGKMYRVALNSFTKEMSEWTSV